MKLCIVGTGYVGLSNAILFSKNHQVVALDIDRERVENLNNGCSPIQDELMDRYLNHAQTFGYGGYCLPKDTRRLLVNDQKVSQNLIEAIISSNTIRKDFVSEQILQKKPKIVGIYRLVMQQGLDNSRESAIQCIMKRLKAKGLEVITDESNLNDVTFFNSTVFSLLEQFKQKSAVIAANRIVAEFNDVVDKVYTRDLFGEN